mmetsp:Transcript_16919/g.38957  ORF Transcript_16919/g.38957 Transcript_16919/m.38957 type:complete len:219 (+) Transcript_16919:1033-1689(+)
MTTTRLEERSKPFETYLEVPTEKDWDLGQHWFLFQVYNPNFFFFLWVCMVAALNAWSLLFPHVQDLDHLLFFREIRVDQIHKELSGVRVLGHWISNIRKVRNRIDHVTNVRDSGSTHDHTLIELFVNLGTRCMNCTNCDQSLVFGNFNQTLHHLHGRGSIPKEVQKQAKLIEQECKQIHKAFLQPTTHLQSSGRFVQENNTGLLYQRNADRKTASLTT